MKYKKYYIYITMSTSMSYNPGSVRSSIRRQQNFTQKKVEDIGVRKNGGGLFFADISGPICLVPSDNYINIFTNVNGEIHPNVNHLGNNFKGGSKWRVLGGGTRLHYKGENFVGQISSYVSLKPNTSDNRILSVPITDSGFGYTTPPSVLFNGDGNDALATAILNEATQEIDSINVEVGGSGWSDNGTTASLSGSPDNASLGSPIVGKITQVNTAVYKNGVLLDDDTITNVIGDPNNYFTSNSEMNYVHPIKKGDIFDLRIKNDSTTSHNYHIYQALLNIVPIELSV